MAAQRLVTFTTDFGISEHYVGTMKGVIYNLNPTATVVDICNSVQSYDVLDGALTIAQAYPYFPAGTVHMVVVDPGVGTSRRPILVESGKYLFVAPDNGVLSLVYEREERFTVRHITAEHYFLHPVSQTFHGRDVFSAVSGWLSRGDVEAAKFGEPVTDFVRFAAPRPKPAGGNQLKGVVIKVDKFGNLITNITPRDLPQLAEPQPALKIAVGKHEVSRVLAAYGQGAAGEAFGILGSMGYLEIATNRGSAVRLLGADKGTEVTVQIGT